MLRNLSDLLGPVPMEAFRSHLRRREFFYRRGGDTNRFAELFGWDEFLSLIEDGTIPSRTLTVTRNRSRVPGFFYRSHSGVRGEAIAQLLASGGSIVAYGVQPYVDDVGALCRDIGEELEERVEFGLIATTGDSGALETHFDYPDMLILQLEGAKRWRIETDPVPDPYPGMALPSLPPALDPSTELCLEAGDILFLPAGHRHICENASPRSLHAAIFFWPLSLQRAIELIARRCLEDPQARRPLRSGGTTETDNDDLKAALQRTIDQVSLSELRADHLKYAGPRTERRFRDEAD